MANITSWTDLNNIRNALSTDYVLTDDLLTTDGDYAGIGDSWVPINSFTGNFDGDMHTIDGLTVNTSSYSNPDYPAMFGLCNASKTIKNLYLTNINITGNSNNTNTYAGGVMGRGWGFTFSKIYVSGTMNVSMGGGLLGRLEGGDVSNCYSSVNITINNTYGKAYGGGCLFGHLRSGATVKNCYTTGDCHSAGAYCGVFAGVIEGQSPINCYSVGIIDGTSSTKGNFMGYSDGGTTNCGCNINAGATYDRGYESANVTYRVSDLTVFYDKTHDIYDTQTPVWDFTTPIWYEWVNDYPHFITQPIPKFNPFISSKLGQAAD